MFLSGCCGSGRVDPGVCGLRSVCVAMGIRQRSIKRSFSHDGLYDSFPARAASDHRGASSFEHRTTARSWHIERRIRWTLTLPAQLG